jgi:DNA-directed RNA polymerase subunit K/omega
MNTQKARDFSDDDDDENSSEDELYRSSRRRRKVDEEDEDEEDDVEDEDEEDEDDVEDAVVELEDEDEDEDKEDRMMKEEEEEETDEEDEDDEGMNRLRKINGEMRRQVMQKFHPELKFRNTDEIEKMAQVVRNSQGQIVDPLHRSLPILTKYERTRILGERARQLEEGATPFIKVPQEIIDSYVIAEMELKEKATAFIIERPMPSGGSEYWRLADLEMI